MKTSVILLKDIADKNYGEHIKNLSNAYENAGFEIDTVYAVNYTDDLGIMHAFNDLSSRAEILLVVGADLSSEKVESLVLERFNTQSVENENAKIFANEYFKRSGEQVDEKYYNLPINSTLIPNINGKYQGYMIEEEVITLCVLPKAEYEQISSGEKYFLSYLETKYKGKTEKITLKYFGDGNRLYKTVEKLQKTTPFTFVITPKFGDWKVEMEFDNEQDKREILRQIISNIGEDIYAETDVTLSQRLYDLLKLRGLKFATAESFTAGKIASSLIELSGASAFFHEGVVAYSNTSKVERLNVKQADLDQHGAVSSIVAYQMCAGLLMKGDIDVAVSTTGIAGPKSDNTEKPVGLCYIGVGMKDGVHTYKYNLKGTREEITETAVNTAMFLAIKNLKRI